MSTGTVIFYAEDKGWGFIRPDEGGADLFAHAKSLVGASSLMQGQRVEFDAGQVAVSQCPVDGAE